MDDQVQRLVDKVWAKFQQTPPDRRFSEWPRAVFARIWPPSETVSSHELC